MITIALVTEANRYGLVMRQESQSIVLQVIEEAHGIGAEQDARRHLLPVIGLEPAARSGPADSRDAMLGEF